MHHHVVAFQFKPHVTPVQIAQLSVALDDLASRLDGLISYACGTDLGLREGNDDFAVAAAFDSVESLTAYLAHPLHLRIVAEHVTALVAEKHGAQFVTA